MCQRHKTWLTRCRDILRLLWRGRHGGAAGKLTRLHGPSQAESNTVGSPRPRHAGRPPQCLAGHSGGSLPRPAWPGQAPCATAGVAGVRAARGAGGRESGRRGQLSGRAAKFGAAIDPVTTAIHKPSAIALAEPCSARFCHCPPQARDGKT